MNKARLDLALVARGMAPSRQRGQALIMAGRVLVNDQPATKAGQSVRETDRIIVKGGDLPYVSRGGLKLEAALKASRLAVDGRICLDVGASTGGFTDCLLQHGARQVFALDVGYGQLAWKLRQDPRVVVMERTNVRHLPTDAFPGAMDLVTIDTSFISLKLVIPAVLHFTHSQTKILALIKPQFEVGKAQVGKGGVVRDPTLHQSVIEGISRFSLELGLTPETVVPSPITGPKGNREFVMVLNCSNLE